MNLTWSQFFFFGARLVDSKVQLKNKQVGISRITLKKQCGETSLTKYKDIFQSLCHLKKAV